MDVKRYFYAIEGNINEAELVERVKKIKGVEDAFFENGGLTYLLLENVDEYDVLVASIEICEALGGTLVVGEDEDKSIQENESVEEADKKKDSLEAESSPEEKEAYSYEDRIVEEKKKLKGETLFRLGELTLSIILVVVSFFVKSSGSSLNLKTLLCVVAYAVSGYEIFYSAFVTAIKKKKIRTDALITVASLFGAFFGYISESATFIVLYALAKELEGFASRLSALSFDEIFYTGSASLRLENGEPRSVEGVREGDVLLLKQYDVIPTDGVALSSARVDAYRSEGIYEKDARVGDLIFAGSVVLSESLSFQAKTTNEESRIVKRKKEFEKRTEALKGRPSKLFWLDCGLSLAFLAATFIAPLFYTNYGTGLTEWAGRFISVAFVSNFSYSAFLSVKNARLAFVAAKYVGVDFNNGESFTALSTANSFSVKASFLTEKGELKKDALGTLRELYYSGAKNVTVDFDCELDEKAKEKIDLVDKAFRGEKKIVAGKGGEIGFSGECEGVRIENGEIAMLPLAYDAAKRAKKRSLLIKLLSVVKVVCVFVCAFLPSAYFSPLYVAIASGIALSVSAAACLTSANVAK